MSVLYLDTFSGISGDMFLGAMIDLGVDPAVLERELRKLSLDGWHLHVSRQQRSGISGTKCDVHLDHEHEHEHEAGHEHGHTHPHEHEHEHEHEHSHEHGHEHGHKPGHRHEHEQEHEHGRTFAEIRELISRSKISDWAKAKALAIFKRVAVAEGKIHGQTPDAVHFHEVGAIDSIIDIVGAAIALDLLGRPDVLASPVVEGTGWIRCAHGRFPIPAPATLEILAARGVRVTQCDEPHELVTPTGAALLAELAGSFAPLRDLAPRKIGYGLGTRENRTRPNVLRALLCEGPAAGAPDWETDTIAVLQTNLDDISAEILGRFVEQAFAAGALDVFHTPIQMKKNRPGTLLSVLCTAEEADRFSEMILRETTAFGVRRHFTERRKLRREIRTVSTAHGPVSVKIGLLNGHVVQVAPEFESCRRLADETRVPLQHIYEAARRAVPLP